jgi:ferric-dicitrate binding protein FerR (iron transport regulator)
MDDKNIEEELKKIWDENPEPQSDLKKEASWQEFQAKAFSPKKRKFKPWRYAAAAAILLFMFVGAGIYFTKDSLGNSILVASNVVENLTSKVKTVMLPDGSFVELNPNSKIIYANYFAVNRKIEIEGEAYFKVIKDKKHPFQVFCHETTTTVLGTSFTVQGNAAEEVTVSLYEGSVRMNVKGQTKNWILKPGEKFIYGNKTAVVEEFNRFIDFDNEKLNSLCTYVEMNYGYKMSIPEEYVNQRITLRINKKEDLKIIVQLISEMYNLNFEINDEVKQISFQ